MTKNTNNGVPSGLNQPPPNDNYAHEGLPIGAAVSDVGSGSSGLLIAGILLIVAVLVGVTAITRKN